MRRTCEAPARGARPPAPSAAPTILAAAALLLWSPVAARADDARQKQQIVFAEIPAHRVGDPPFDIAATASSGLPVVVEVVAGPAVLHGRRLRLTGQDGLVIVRATQAGNDRFLPAQPAERAFSVQAAPRPPSFVLQPAGGRFAIGEAVILSAQASGSPPPAYQWRRNGADIPGANQRTLAIASASPSDAGSYDVVASNTSGTAVSAGAAVTVAKRPQTLSFQAIPAAVQGQPVSLTANASSGLPVHYDVVSGSAILNGSVLTAQSGTVVVQASQPGDDTYDAAPPVMQTVTILPGPR